MQICCPKCKTAYEIADNLAGELKKVRCANCHEIFVPKDCEISINLQAESFDDDVEITQAPAVEESAPAAAEQPSSASETQTATEPPAQEAPTQSDDIKEMFARLSAKTEEVFAAEASVPAYKKIWYQIRDFFGLNRRSNYKYYIVLLLTLLLLALYNWRYAVVRHVAFMEPVYSLVGIKATIPGEGLEFQNITRREFEKDDINHMEIKGFIVNTTDHEIKIPTIHVELLNRDAEFIEEKDVTPPLNSVQPNGNVAFNIILAKPSSLTKYIYLTFIDKEN